MNRETSMGSAGPGRRRSFRLALLITLALLSGIEVALRVLFAIRDGVRTVDYRTRADAYQRADWPERYFQEFERAQVAQWTPYVYWRRLPFRGELITIDERGLRKTWNPPACQGPEPVGLRVFMYGGSTMWGTGARDDYTIPSLVSRRLAETPQLAACVQNFGESGYVSSQDLVALLLELRRGARPHVVVFLDGVNDAFAAYQLGEGGIPQNEWRRREEFKLSERPGTMLRLGLIGVLRSSALFRLAEAVNARVLPRSLDKGVAHARETSREETLAREVVAAYAGNLELIERLADTYGFRALFYWQPSVYTKSTLTPFEAREGARRGSFGPFYLKVHAALASDRSVVTRTSFRDLSHIFASRSEPLFIDFAHLSERGNALVAEQIAADIRVLMAEEPLARLRKEKRASVGAEPRNAGADAAGGPPLS